MEDLPAHLEQAARAASMAAICPFSEDTRMRSVRFHTTGGPDTLRCDEVPIPPPGPGELLIKIAAAGVNFADAQRRAGGPYPAPTPLPFNPGCEFAGTVVGCGAGADPEAWMGRPVVVANTAGGGYAEYACAPAVQAIPTPRGLSAEDAVALLVQGLTAAMSLREAGGLTPDKTVFIEAATGGVGSMAVQLARLFGARQIIAGVGDDHKLAQALAFGADVAINYARPDWPQQVREHTGGQGVDLFLDMTSGDLLRQGQACLAPFGRIVVYGAAAPTPGALDAALLAARGQSMVGFFLGLYFQHRPTAPITALHELAGHVVAGRLKPHIGGRWPLEQAAQAHRTIESRRSVGKLILVP